MASPRPAPPRCDAHTPFTRSTRCRPNILCGRATPRTTCWPPARFQGDAFAKNLALVTEVESIAQAKGCTASQLALAWVLARAPFIVPIPGTKRRTYLEENAGALGVELSAGEIATIEAVFPKGAAAGTRYTEAMMKFVNA